MNRCERPANNNVEHKLIIQNEIIWTMTSFKSMDSATNDDESTDYSIEFLNSLDILPQGWLCRNISQPNIWTIGFTRRYLKVNCKMRNSHFMDPDDPVLD